MQNLQSFYRFLIAFATVLSPLCSGFAQSGYAVLFKGDTVRGEIKILSYDPVDRLQVLKDGKKTIIQAMQVKRMMLDQQVYQPVRRENTIRFMKVMKEGYLSLLAFNDQGTGNTWDGTYLLKRDGHGIDAPNLAFKKVMGKFLSDCPSVKEKLESGELAKRDLPHIVDFYNACIESKPIAVAEPVAVKVDVDKILAVDQFIKQVQSQSFASQKDALDMLKDIKTKVAKKEAVPNYLRDGLRSYLKDQPSLLTGAENLLSLLDK